MTIEQARGAAPGDRGDEGPAVGRAEPARRRRAVLVADDDDDMRELLAQALRAEGLMAFEFADGFAVLDRVLSSPPGEWPRGGFDLLVSDVYMPRLGGLELLEALRAARLTTPVILMSGFADATTRERARRLDARLLEKPFALGRLCDLASALLAASPGPR